MLSKTTILQHLDSLHEHKMAKEILVPLLNKMGLKGVRFTGGADEHGIDIEFYELTQPERRRSYVGIQVKKGDVQYGAGGGKGTVRELQNQAEEAFQKEIHDLSGRRVGFISRFIVAVTGDINEKARVAIGRVRQKGGDRQIDYWDGDRIAEYIQKHWMAEFQEKFGVREDPSGQDSGPAIVDEDYIRSEFPKLVTTCEKVRRTVSSTEWEFLRAIVEVCLENDLFSAGLSDILLLLGRSEDFFSEELRHLICDLKYVDVDDGEYSLAGHASAFKTLASRIQEELVDAGEDPEQTMAILDELVY